VMWHKFDFKEKGVHRQIQSHLVVEGEDPVNTAMSKTVGLPLAIGARLVLQGKLQKPGVHIPTTKDVYTPILDELESMGFVMHDREVEVKV